MKYFRYFFLIAILGESSPIADAQTLGEVLRSAQRRYLLIQEKDNNEIRLENAEQNPGNQRILHPIYSIRWPGELSSYPTDTEVDALSISDQLKALKQASENLAGYVDRRRLTSGVGLIENLNFDELGIRLQIDDIPAAVQMVAWRIFYCSTVRWPLLWKKSYRYRSEWPLKVHPSVPLIFSGAGDTLPNRDHRARVTMGISDEGGSIEDTDDPPDHVSDTQYFEHSESSENVEIIKAIGDDSFSGSIQIFTDFDYGINRMLGLSWPLEGNHDLYQPANQCWLDEPINAAAPKSFIAPGVFGGDVSGLSFSGSWHEEPVAESPGWSWPHFIVKYPSQNSLSLNPWEKAIYFSQYYGSSCQLDFASLFSANFGTEFSSLPDRIPEKIPPLTLIPEFAKKRLILPLANMPDNECMLIWDFPSFFNGPRGGFIDGSLSVRKAIDVRGSGNWDAVYSGKSTDREQEFVWVGGECDPNGRWDNFFTYAQEWWRPVLTQLITATYGINISQIDKFSYKIDFYLKDQIGMKSGSTGRYAFNGVPVETFTVENPARDITEAGRLRITTSGLRIYELNVSQSFDSYGSLDTSTCSFTGKFGATTFIHKAVKIEEAQADSNDNFTRLYTITDQTLLDGRKLPEVTTTYRSPGIPLEIDKIIERHADEMRTTTFTYSPNVTVEQTGGANPYIARYDSNDLLTHYSSGSYDLQISYNGANVIRTEKRNGAQVRKTTTTYSNGLSRAVTTVEGATGSVPAMVEYYPGNDPINPWGLKLERGYDGALTTYSYRWEGENFVTEQKSRPGNGTAKETVTAGTRTVTTLNPAGQVIGVDVSDLESGKSLDAL